MGYKVDFDALDTMYGNISQRVSVWQEKLSTVATAATALAESDGMSGSGADNVRSYLSNVHGTIQGLLQQLITLHVSNCLVYKQDYMTNIDTSLHASIQEAELSRLRSGLDLQRRKAITVDGSVRDALYRIRDIFYVSYRDVSSVDAAHIGLTTFLQDLDEEIRTLEQRHMAEDFVNTERMISSLTSFIQEQMAQGRSYKTDFTVEALAGSESFRNMYDSYLAVSKELETKEVAINTAIENENQRAADLQKEYEERQKKANVIKWVVTGVCVIGSIVAIAATGGAATPLVVGAVSGISGAVMAGTNNLADQYVQNGNLKDTDWGDFGKDVFIGGVSGFVTGYVGAGIGGAVTSGLSKTATGAALLNSSNTAVRIGTGVVIGSTSEVVSGVASRGAATLVTTGELDKALDAAFDPEQMVYDAAIGGATGGFGEYKNMKHENSVKPSDSTDWENTANSQEEIDILSEMDENGEFLIDGEDYGSVKPTNDFVEPDAPKRRLPSEKNGTIIGDRDSGTFEYVPNDSKAQATMKEYGQTTVKYKEGQPDFSPYTKHNTSWGEVDCEVEIAHMSGSRTGVDNNYGQADEMLAKKISQETGKTVTATDVAEYRKSNGLTWHETTDRHTMQLIPTEINAKCAHTGGTAWKNYEQIMGDVSHNYD